MKISRLFLIAILLGWSGVGRAEDTNAPPAPDTVVESPVVEVEEATDPELALTEDVVSPSTEVEPESDREPKRALWVWGTNAMRENPALWNELLAFCGAHGVTELFMMVNVDFSKDKEGRPVATLRTPGRVREMLSSADQAGIRVYAMHGDPYFAEAAEHDRVLTLVEELIRYNNEAFSTELFAGIRLGVEPYTLDAWQKGGEAKEMLMRDWLDMNRKVAALIHERAPGLPYGIDIPFWLDSRDEKDVPRHALEYNGVQQNLSRHLIGLVDQVGVLAYRPTATGPSGVVALATDELAYASELGGVRVYLGVTVEPPETGRVPPYTTLGTQPLDQVLATFDAIDEEASSYSAYEGVAIHHYHAYRAMIDRAKPEEEPAPAVEPVKPVDEPIEPEIPASG